MDRLKKVITVARSFTGLPIGIDLDPIGNFIIIIPMYSDELMNALLREYFAPLAQQRGVTHPNTLDTVLVLVEALDDNV